MKLINNSIFLTLLTLASCTFNGSFKSAQAPDHIKSITVEDCYNETPGGPPNMSLVFTEKTKLYFQRNTKFEIANTEGDANLQVNIVQYHVTPVAITGNQTQEVASQNRLTITIEAQYTDNIKDENSFKKNFSKFADFEAEENLSDVEDRLVNDIADLLIVDIFNAAYDNW